MLSLPREIYDKYDRVVKSCKVWSTSVPSPQRARIAGLRASSFGDLIFVDHAEIKFGTSLYLVLLIIDGATNRLRATTLTTLEAPETLGALRLWIEGNRCMPKGIVGDQAFSRICSWSFTSFMESHLIHVDQGHLGPSEPGQLSGCSNALGLHGQVS